VGVIPKFGKSPRGAWIVDEPQSRAAEAYRALRSSIAQSTSEGQATRVVLIASARPGEGKATTCLNTAAALAAQGNRVLIVNADLRRTQPPAAWQEPEGKGLSRFLEGTSGDLHELLTLADIPGVSVLPAGPATARAPELLASPRFVDLLHLLRDEFDHILIDSPPAMLYTDAQVLAGCADASMLVVKASKTSRQDAAHVLDMLKGTPAQMLGVVFNGADIKAGSYKKFGYQL
jgi:polysaccharide biosynthesis transport protein